MHKFITELTDRDIIESDYLIAEIAVKKKKNGEDYFNLNLTDKSGSIMARMWDNFSGLVELKKGDFIQVNAQVGSYNGNLQLTLSEAKKIDQEQYKIEDYLKKTTRDIDQMYISLLEHVDSIEKEHLKKLLTLFFVEDKKFIEEFKKVPAGKVMHNAFLGGLLEHVVDILAVADFVCTQYKGIDIDLLKTGVIVHDIGKIRELEYGLSLDYTDEGKLIGHHVIGVKMINEKISKIEDFPQRDQMMLEHMILSHHGKPEWGSPKTPAILEAVILHYLDNLDAKITGFQQFVENNPPQDNWTRRAFMFDNSTLFTG